MAREETAFSFVSKILADLRLSNYRDKFLKREFKNVKEVMELELEDLEYVSTRPEIRDRIHERLVEEREKTYFIGDFKSTYHTSLVQQKNPASDSQIKILAKEISEFIKSLSRRNLYKKGMAQNIVATCGVMYQCVLRKDDIGGIRFLKSKVEEKTNYLNKRKRTRVDNRKKRISEIDELDDGGSSNEDESLVEEGEISLREFVRSNYTISYKPKEDDDYFFNFACESEPDEEMDCSDYDDDEDDGLVDDGERIEDLGIHQYISWNKNFENEILLSQSSPDLNEHENSEKDLSEHDENDLGEHDENDLSEHQEDVSNKNQSKNQNNGRIHNKEPLRRSNRRRAVLSNCSNQMQGKTSKSPPSRSNSKKMCNQIEKPSEIVIR